MNDQNNPVLITGGGISGLVAAIALKRYGFAVEVFERAEHLRTVGGTGLTLWSNAIAALGQLGLANVIRDKGAVIQTSEVFTAKGELLVESKVKQLTDEIGFPSVGIRRKDVLETLFNACDGIPVHFGMPCTNVSVLDGGVEVRFENGETRRGCALIGADGLRSAVREHVVGDEEPTYMGHTVWRGISDDNGGMNAGSVYMMWGPRGVRGGAWYVDDTHVNWFVGVNTPPGGLDQAGVKEQILRKVAGFKSPLPAMIQAMSEQNIIRTDIFARDKVDNWGEGPITLIGDAAHAMPTVLGQGACQAIEDAVVLADFMRKADSIEAGLRAYEQHRKPRVDWIRENVYKLGRFQDFENPLFIWLRNSITKMMSTDNSMKMWQEILTFPG